MFHGYSLFLLEITQLIGLVNNNLKAILYLPICVILMQTEGQCCNVKTGGDPAIMGRTGIALVCLGYKFFHIGIFVHRLL